MCVCVCEVNIMPKGSVDGLMVVARTAKELMSDAVRVCVRMCVFVCLCEGVCMLCLVTLDGGGEKEKKRGEGMKVCVCGAPVFGVMWWWTGQTSLLFALIVCCCLMIKKTMIMLFAVEIDLLCCLVSKTNQRDKQMCAVETTFQDSLMNAALSHLLLSHLLLSHLLFLFFVLHFPNLSLSSL